VTRLALFDLDHTLLSGDSDVLWCEFLVGQGHLARAEFEPRNLQMAARYRAGSVTPAEFCNFYVATLAGQTPEGWQALRKQFLREVIAPRMPDSARELVELHRRCGDTLLLTTATNRYITELTAAHLGIDHLIATEAELIDGRFTGRTTGTLNMREGKVVRLCDWLQANGLAGSLMGEAIFYSDSANDLPLLRAVGRPVAIDPDETLHAVATAAGWEVRRLRR